MAQHQHHVGAAVLVTLLLCVLTPSVQAQGAPTDTEVFMGAFISSIPGLNDLWKGRDYCSYPGVMCDANGVASIALQDVLTDGDIIMGHAPELYRKVNGATVRVRAISFRGLRGIRGTFPASWGRLVQLEELDLSGTGMGGEIPDEWTGMRSLKSVAISGTKACSGLPNWKEKSMPQLVSVDFSNNGMRGPLSRNFGSFSGRKMTLDISGNSFCGCVPSTWASDTLRDAAAAADPVLLQPNCSSINACSKKIYRCMYNDAAALATGSPLLVLFITVAIAFALVCASAV